MTIRHRLPATALCLCLGAALVSPTAAAAPAPKPDNTKVTSTHPKVAPYADPQLSSSPSSGQPGLIYALRGLSSEAIAPLGGIGGVLAAYSTFVVIHDLYELYVARLTDLARIDHSPAPIDLWAQYHLPVPGQLSSTVSSVGGNTGSARMPAASSALPLPLR